jgi:hypothetical protein
MRPPPAPLLEGTMETRRGYRRREFLRQVPLAVAGIAAFPTIVKASALGRGLAVPPSDRIVMAGIGYGMQGPPNMRSLLGKRGVQWVAVCDLDDKPLDEARRTVNEHYGNEDCRTYKDYRELFAREDLDAVSIAVPDHWHAIMSIDAVRAGLDVYGEKPLTHSLREGRALCDAVKRYGRVWQTGSWQRSEDNFHRACELVRNGRIGKILRVEVGLPSGYTDFARTFGQEKIEAPPPGARLRNLDRPGSMGTLLQGTRAHELALEHGLRRRTADRLGRTSSRHSSLGTRPRAHRAGEISGEASSPRPAASTTPQHATSLTRCTPTALPSSWRAATRRSRAGRNGLASTAGYGSIEVASKASRRTSSTRRLDRTRLGSITAAITIRTSSTASGAAP